TWLVICTMTAGLQKIFSPDPAVGFLAHAAKFEAALQANQLLGPAKSFEEMRRIVMNDRIDAALRGPFVPVVVAIVVYGIGACLKAWRAEGWTAREAEPGIAPAE